MRTVLLAFVLIFAVTPAFAQDEWTDYVVRVSGVYRQDPPEELETRLAALAEADSPVDPAAQAALAEERTKLEREIDRRTGYILLGFTARTDRRLQRVDERETLLGFVMDPTPRIMRTAAELEPGDFVRIGRRGTGDLISISGRGYATAKAMAPIERPDWWPEERVDQAPATEADPDVEEPAKVFTELTLDNVEERESSTKYRYTLRIRGIEAPQEARVARVTGWLRPRTERGERLGPFPFDVDVKYYDEAEDFLSNVSWDVFSKGTAKFEGEAMTFDVFRVDFDPE